MTRERWLEEYVTACRIRDYIIPVKWPLEVLRFHFLLDPNPDPGPESEHLYSLCTWIGLTWILILHCLPDSTWADRNLAEVGRRLGKMMEHSNQSQPNPGARADGTHCTSLSAKSGSYSTGAPGYEGRKVTMAQLALAS